MSNETIRRRMQKIKAGDPTPEDVEFYRRNREWVIHHHFRTELAANGQGDPAALDRLVAYLDGLMRFKP